jgi:hypothetical protein
MVFHFLRVVFIEPSPHTYFHGLQFQWWYLELIEMISLLDIEGLTLGCFY